jgi:hypothetical protein
MVARPGGPMTFRFILQPAMAAAMALRDGAHDARLGRRAISLGRASRRAGPRGPQRTLLGGDRLDLENPDPRGRDGRRLPVARAQDIYPAQAAVIAILLAFVPYLLLRGPMERVARHWVARPAVK